jgi:hypothetical protein
MYHLACYKGDASVNANNFDLPAVNDSVLTLSNGHYILTQPARVKIAYVQAPSLTLARINTPKLRATSLPYIEPLRVGALPGNLPPAALYETNQLNLDPIDEIAIEVSNNNGISTEVTIAGLFLEMSNTPIPSGPSFTIRATSSFTATDGAWTNGAITFDQVLPGNIDLALFALTVLANQTVILCAKAIVVCWENLTAWHNHKLRYSPTVQTVRRLYSWILSALGN